MATDEYEKRVQELIDEGMSRSDAQGVADAEGMMGMGESDMPEIPGLDEDVDDALDF